MQNPVRTTRVCISSTYQAFLSSGLLQFNPDTWSIVWFHKSKDQSYKTAPASQCQGMLPAWGGFKKVIEKFLEDEEVEMLERSRHSYLVCRHLKQWLNHYRRPTLSTWFSSWKTKSCIRINTWSSDLFIDLYFISNVIESDYPGVGDPLPLPAKVVMEGETLSKVIVGMVCKLLQGKMLEKKGFLMEEMLLEVVWGMGLYLPRNTVKRVADFMINLCIYVPVT